MERARTTGRRRYRPQAPQKSVGKAYGCWLIGLFICPGLHRFYLGMNTSASLMLGIVLVAVGLAAYGLGEIYSSYLGMLSPGAIATDPSLILEDAKQWFGYAVASAGAAFVWMLVDLLLIPRLVRRASQRWQL